MRSRRITGYLEIAWETVEGLGLGGAGRVGDRSGLVSGDGAGLAGDRDRWVACDGGAIAGRAGDRVRWMACGGGGTFPGIPGIVGG